MLSVFFGNLSEEKERRGENDLSIDLDENLTNKFASFSILTV